MKLSKKKIINCNKIIQEFVKSSRFYNKKFNFL